jgi:hypothetical protein
MRAIRTLLALALVVVGISIVSRMIRYPFIESVSGVVLGLAMVLLGAFRLRALYRKHA